MLTWLKIISCVDHQGSRALVLFCSEGITFLQELGRRMLMVTDEFARQHICFKGFQLQCNILFEFCSGVFFGVIVNDDEDNV